MDEQELIRLVQEGNEMAFGKIVTAYKDRIVNYLYQFTGDYQKAVELSQETFLRFFSRPSNTGRSLRCRHGSMRSPRTWLGPR
jgi:DNA-directed RNA polymerase specialized sigma24 family protein